MNEDATVGKEGAGSPFEDPALPTRSTATCEPPIADDADDSQADVEEAFAQAFGSLLAEVPPKPPQTNGHDTEEPWECAAYGLPPDIVEGLRMWASKDADLVRQGDHIIFTGRGPQDLRPHHLGMAKVLGFIGTDEEKAADMERLLGQIRSKYEARRSGEPEPDPDAPVVDEGGWRLDIPKTLAEIEALFAEERETVIDHHVVPAAAEHTPWPAEILDVADPIARAFGWSSDAVALQMLGIASACMAAGVELEVTPAHREYPVLWTCVAAGTGARKTALRSCLEGGLRAVEKEMHEDSSRAMESWKEEYTNAKASYDQAKKDVVARERAAREVIELETRKPAEKIWLFAGEATPESFGAMADKQRCLTLLTDEGGTVLGAAGEYSDARSRASKRRQDWARYCALYDGQPLRVMRVGRIHMNHGIFVPMSISTQPDVVLSVMAQALVDESGFLPRWLFLVSDRREPEPPGDAFARASTSFDRATRWLATWGRQFAASGSRPIPMLTEPDAKDLVDEATGPLRDAIERQADEISDIEPFIARFHGHIYRIALVMKFLLAALGGTAPQDVAMGNLTRSDVEAALPLARTVLKQLLNLKAEAQKNTREDVIGADLTVEIARRLLDPDMQQALTQETLGHDGQAYRVFVVRKSDPIRRKWRGFKQAEERLPGAISRAMRTLAELGIFRLANRTAGPGRGAATYYVNPHFASPSRQREPGEDIEL